MGQVIFLNSPVSGGVILGGLVLGNPYLAGMAALGTITSTATAHVSGLHIHDGLWGYNGCLVGCAAAVFGPSTILACTTSTLVGAIAAPFVGIALKEGMGSIPQWTFAFNFVALTSLLRTRPLLPPTVLEGVDESTPTIAVVNHGTSFLLAPLNGISQIFVVESALTGGVIVGGIALYSPGLAAHAVMGSTVGMAVGMAIGADPSEWSIGLWGFNSALTSMGVGVFFVHSAPVMALSAGGAAVTAAVFGAMKTIFGVYGAPCLTVPFCVTMSGCYVLRNNVAGLQLARNPHSPEKNTE